MTTTGRVRGIPVDFATEDEALARLHKLVNDEPSLSRQNLKFALAEVRYVPNKIKAYGNAWAAKYMLKETELELKDHKFVDTIK